MKHSHASAEMEFADGEASGPAIEEMLTAVRARLERELAIVRRPPARVGFIDSRIGRLLAAESPRGLVALSYVDRHDGNSVVAALRRLFDPVEDRELADRVGEEIERLLEGDATAVAGRAVDFSLVPSPFQRRAFERLRAVPAGAVVTYQGLAAAVGAPTGQRAIGNTMASNPVCIYVPCHRVIRSDGRVGNYGGGVERKLTLLRSEGFKVDRGNRVPDGAVYGHWQTHIFCRPDCSAVRRAERRRWIIFGNAENARHAGMRACKLCCPD
jgi:methylated-DNA-[protein]-cysteine S-methyltransferase